MIEPSLKTYTLIGRSSSRPGFPTHGEFIAYMDGRNVVTEICGPWNTELSDDYWRQSRDVIAWLDKGGPWAGTFVIHGSAMLSPEGFAGVRTRLIESSGSKRLPTALVIGPTVEGYGLVDDLYRQTYEGVCRMELFETIAEARVWLAQLVPLGPG
jgi:hypothetical protein